MNQEKLIKELARIAKEHFSPHHPWDGIHTICEAAIEEINRLSEKDMSQLVETLSPEDVERENSILKKRIDDSITLLTDFDGYFDPNTGEGDLQSLSEIVWEVTGILKGVETTFIPFPDGKGGIYCTGKNISASEKDRSDVDIFAELANELGEDEEDLRDAFGVLAEKVFTMNKDKDMDRERYDMLMMGGLREFGDSDNTKQIPQLTDDEIADGWHFCHDWGGLLIHPACPEYESCACLGQEKFKKIGPPPLGIDYDNERGKWFFWDEVWANPIGYWDTEEEAQHAHRLYFESLDGRGFPDLPHDNHDIED